MMSEASWDTYTALDLKSNESNAKDHHLSSSVLRDERFCKYRLSNAETETILYKVLVVSVKTALLVSVYELVGCSSNTRQPADGRHAVVVKQS
jgi:hypothetical protein